MKDRERGKQQTANFYDMPVIVKAHKTCKISFNFLYTRMVINFSSQFTSHLSSSGCSELRERGAINIYDDYWQHRKSLSVCFILCPYFEGIKNFMKSINIIFLLEGDFWLENFFFIASQKVGGYCSVNIIKVELWEFPFYACIIPALFSRSPMLTNRAGKVQ